MKKLSLLIIFATQLISFQNTIHAELYDDVCDALQLSGVTYFSYLAYILGKNAYIGISLWNSYNTTTETQS